MTGHTAAAPARLAEQPPQTTSSIKSVAWSCSFFFVSGFPALLYQIVWQRALFTLYGVNIESVTMVVTAFMLGLGLGSLLGGVISRSRTWPLLRVFGLTELLVASYGIVSLKVFHWAANSTAGSSSLETGVVAFTLVVLPTVLMGSTLPVLVSYTVRLSRNVGTSVGALYAANTMGSAAACFCAGLFLMLWLGEWKTVALAAGLNALVGVTVLLWDLLRSKATAAARLDGDLLIQDKPVMEKSKRTEDENARVSFTTALIASAAAGFVSLGYEIVWYRLFSFTTGGIAKSFAFLLGAYLAGIAFGSLVSNRICLKITDPQAFIRILVGTVFAANLLGFLVGPILFNLVIHASYLWALMPIGIAAACLGTVFPLLCHISIRPNEQVGARTSYLYLSNIVGSALGSYLTGFVLMDVLPLSYVCVVLTLLGFGLGVALMLNAKLKRSRLVVSALAALAAALFVVQAAEPLFRDMYDKMLLKDKYVITARSAVIVENRSGVITVTPQGMVFGGGVYDGQFNVSLVNDSNGIQRAFSLSYFHPNPREVLMVGLSSGSWAQVIANHPQVEHLTIVEINPGYLPLVQNAPEVSSLLQNSKVEIAIDDGRRWLVRNSGRKFDVIVMNNTQHWRSNASNLLSTDFLQLIRRHLKPGGVHFYNTTDSVDAMMTGMRFFPYGIRLANFAVVSDSPLQLDANRWHDTLLRYSIDGKPVFDLSQDQPRRRLQEVFAMAFTMNHDVFGFFTLESADHMSARFGKTRMITDDNMGTEWEK